MINQVCMIYMLFFGNCYALPILHDVQDIVLMQSGDNTTWNSLKNAFNDWEKTMTNLERFYDKNAVLRLNTPENGIKISGLDAIKEFFEDEASNHLLKTWERIVWDDRVHKSVLAEPFPGNPGMAVVHYSDQDVGFESCSFTMVYTYDYKIKWANNYCAKMPKAFIKAVFGFTTVKQTFTEFDKALEKGNMAKIAPFYDENAVLRISWGISTTDEKVIEGRDQIQEFLEDLYQCNCFGMTNEYTKNTQIEGGSPGMVYIVWNDAGAGFDNCTTTFVFNADYKIVWEYVVCESIPDKFKKLVTP